MEDETLCNSSKLQIKLNLIVNIQPVLWRAYAFESKCFVVVPHTLRTRLVRTLSSYNLLGIMLAYLLHLPSFCIIFYLSYILSLSLSLSLSRLACSIFS